MLVPLNTGSFGSSLDQVPDGFLTKLMTPKSSIHPRLRFWFACADAAKSLQLCPTLCDPIDGSHQAPPSLGSQSWTRLKRLSSSSSRIHSFPDSSVGKESTCNAGDPGSVPGSGRSAGEGIGYPLQYSSASLVAQLVKTLPPMQETWV